MSAVEDLAQRFDADRRHLRSVAFRLIGSVADAEDAGQSAWLKASRADPATIENMTGWLTTSTARQAYDQLPAGKPRADQPLDELDWVSGMVSAPADADALLADSVACLSSWTGSHPHNGCLLWCTTCSVCRSRPGPAGGDPPRPACPRLRPPRRAPAGPRPSPRGGFRRAALTVAVPGILDETPHSARHQVGLEHVRSRSAMLDKPFGRRTLLRGAGALGAASLVPWSASCGGDDDALTFFFAANPEEADARMRVIEAFQRRHPDIKVRPLLSGPGAMQQISTFCAGGKCPDVLMAWEFTYAELADRGVLLDLGTMLARDRAFAAELKADSIKSLYDTFTYHGGQYAFPEQWSGNFLFYNKALFAQAGVRPPPARWEQPWTFAEFLDAAKALTKRDGAGRVSQWGFVDTWVASYSAGLFGMNNGVPWSTPRVNPAHLNFDKPAFIEGVQFYADLANKHKVAPTSSETQSMSTMDLFSVGRAAMALGGHWRYQTFDRAEGLDFDVTVLPTGPSARRLGLGAHSNIGTTGLAIAASSRRKQQAWEFVKFSTGPVGQALIGESGLFVPVLKSAINWAGFAKAHRRIANLAVLTGGPAHSEGLPITPQWEKVNALMDRNFGPVLRGSRPATSLANGLSHAIDEVLRSS
jgi:multiple sugar transport system substrate-binding protein